MTSITFTLSQNIINHCSIALRQEIQTLTKVWREVGDEWPDGFDPNDIVIYQIMLDWFTEVKEDIPITENIQSKPFIFMVEVIKRYSQSSNMSTRDKHELTQFIHRVMV